MRSQVWASAQEAHTAQQSSGEALQPWEEGSSHMPEHLAGFKCVQQTPAISRGSWLRALLELLWPEQHPGLQGRRDIPGRGCWQLQRQLLVPALAKAWLSSLAAKPLQ